MIRVLIPIGVVLLQLSIFLSAFVAPGWVRATASDPLSEIDRIFVNVCQSIIDLTGPSLVGTLGLRLYNSALIPGVEGNLANSTCTSAVIKSHTVNHVAAM